MQQRPQEQPRSMREQYAAFVSWLAIACQVLETSIVVFLHHGFGHRYLGLQAVVVIPAILVYSTLWQGHDLNPLMLFLGGYLLACAWARLVSWQARKRGTTHSHYSGSPYVMRWRVFRGWLSERTAKGRVEPLLTFVTGWLLMPVSEPLGSYLMLAAAGLLFSVQLSVSYEHKRMADAQDAYLEQRQLAERFREGGWR